MKLTCLDAAATLAAAVFAVSPLRAATYYVATTGNDGTGDGSQAAPYASIATAVDLDGNPHVSGAAVDIGCYEVAGSATTILVR